MHPITREWSIDVDSTYRHRIEDGSLVFWKPGRTIYLVVWGRPDKENKEQTLAWIKSEAHPHPRWRKEPPATDILWYGYLLKEGDSQKEYFAFNGFAVGDTSYVQLACYYDEETDVFWAEQTWLSLTYQSDEQSS